MTKKLLCLLLALLLCMSTLLACSDQSEPEDPDQTQTSDTPDDPDANDPSDDTPDEPERIWLDSLPDTTLGGIELKFAYFDYSDPVKVGCSIDAVEQNGDLINDAMYNRNTMVEERFDVVLSGENFGGVPGITSTITPILTAGSSDYDILVGYQYYDIGLAATGLMYNFNNLSNKYIDIENPWWSTDYINNINYADKLYWLTGDITLLHIGQIVASYVNADIYEEVAAKDYGSLYNLVRDREWTFETMGEIASLAYVDLNGNDKSDRGDRFGYEQSLGVEMAYCAGIDSSMRDEDGNITVTIDNEKTADIMWYLSDISTADYSTLDMTFEGQLRLFTSGEAMIYFRALRTAEQKTVREMKDDFYIVPIPMGDAYWCEDYRSTCGTGNNIVGIAHTTLYPEESALVLEALAAESNRTVSSIYYDVILKDRYTRDNESKEMLDLIRNSVGVDFVNTWSLGYTGAYDFYATFDTTTVASRIATHAPRWEAILEDLLLKLDELE